MRVLTPITSAVLLAIACANAQAMSLQEAVQSAVDYHPEAKAGINSRLSADEDVKFARGGYYPASIWWPATDASAPTTSTPAA